jgi:hypothetical protein
VNQPGTAGIQQILVLSKVGKACIVSNGTLSFYTLPELSPAFPQLKPLTCGWVGGVDMDAEQNDGQDGVVVMLCYRSKIRLVKVAEAPLKLRDIEFAGCLTAVRRGNFACVADSHSYALLDIVHQQKVPLFTISSVDDQPADRVGTYLDDFASDSGSRNLSPADPLRNTLQEERGHRKTSSLNIFRRDHDNLSLDPSRPGSQRYGFDSPILRKPASRRVSTTDIIPDSASVSDTSKPLPPPPEAGSRPISPSPPKPVVALKPLIASPSSQLFLLVTGTAPDEPSLGIFVNLDGDVDRGTIEFPNYPEHVVVDGRGFDMASSLSTEEFSEEGFVLAVVKRKLGTKTERDVEIQRWDLSSGEKAPPKEWLNIPSLGAEDSTSNENVGLMHLDAETSIAMVEIVDKLAMNPFHFGPTRTKSVQANLKRETEEVEFIRRISRVNAHLTLWRGRDVYWLCRNPVVMKLDTRLQLACAGSESPNSQFSINRRAVESIFNETRGVKSNAELDFLSYGFVKQKAALLLFIDLVIQTLSGALVFEGDRKFTEQALIESELDPRIILGMLPLIQGEVLQKDDGIWMHGGLRQILSVFLKKQNLQEQLSRRREAFEANLLAAVKRVLLFWRKKKGNPSVADGKLIFLTVDAALLHVLLLLDSKTPPGPAIGGSIRAELYALVDNGVDSFDRALELLERFKRLYVLSRLYQKRKSPSMVLSTWRRILEGDEDVGGEFVDGETEVRKYLSKIKDRKLVVENGTWLARRNPKIGVQVFADESSRVVIPPNEALGILRESAPNAVKDYLEYLVFGKMVRF